MSKPRRMNENLSLRLTAEERQDIESAVAAVACSDMPAMGASDFLRIAARLMVTNSRLLGDEIAGSLGRRKLSALDAELVARRLHAMCLRLLMSSWLDVAYICRRYDDLSKALWLWCVAEGTTVRWGTVPAAPRRDAGDFSRDFGVAMKVTLPREPGVDAQSWSSWILENKVGSVYTFGSGA